MTSRTDNQAIVPAVPPPTAPPARRVQTVLLALLIAALLLVSFAIQMPGTEGADWQLFAFYDPGTTLKGDALLAKGYVPTVDFGYTHGLMSLVVGRVGFGVLGRTPWAYLALTLLMEMAMAWGLARILLALGVGWRGIVVFLAALPIAVRPSYLTFTHPLEAMLLILALAEHAQGRRGRALAIVTLCAFVKPSMAYVYGAVLIGLIIRDGIQNSEFRIQNGRLTAWSVRNILPAIVTAGALFAALSLAYGVGPVVSTLLPLTGAKTYAATGFGFFTTAGRSFWILPKLWGYPTLWGYPLSPVGVWLLAAAVSVPATLWAGWRVLVRPQTGDRRAEMLLVFGVLHLAFVLGFYGWPGSWRYYSYLPMLTLALLAALVRLRPWMIGVLVVLALLANTETFGSSIGAWKWKLRTSAGLWAYADQVPEWQEVQRIVGPRQALVMTNGWIPSLPANIEMPDAWFPELGIPTTREMQRVKQQIERAQVVIRWTHYQPFEDVWNAPDRSAFKPTFEGAYFTVEERQ